MIGFLVKTLDSRNHKFAVEDECKISQLKEMIEERLGMPKPRQKLIFMGKVLHDDYNLKDLGINGKVMHLVEKPIETPDQPRLLPSQTFSIGTTTGLRVDFRADRSTNTDLNAERSASRPPPTISYSQMRREMPSTSSPRPSTSREPLMYLPTAARTEIIRRLVAEIKISLDELKEHLEQTGQMRRFRYTMTDDEESMNWFSSRDSPGPRRRRFDTYFTYNDEPDFRQHIPFNFSTRRAIGNKMSYVIPREYAVLLEELECLNLRFTPFRKQYIHILFHSSRRNPSNYNAEEAAANQRVVELISDIFHSFSHAYHAISDITFHGTQPIPRLSSEMISSPQRNALAIQRQRNGAYFIRSGGEAVSDMGGSASVETASGTEPASGAEPASGTEPASSTEPASRSESATGTEPASSTDNAGGLDEASVVNDASAMEEESRMDEARAVEAPASSSPPQRRETTMTPRRGYAREQSESTVNRETRPVAYQIDLQRGQISAANRARLIQTQLLQEALLQVTNASQPLSEEINNTFGEGEQAIVVTMADIHSGQQNENEVHLVQMPRDGLSNSDLIRNIVTTAIRRGIEASFPRSQENNEEPMEQQNGQGQEPRVRPLPSQNEIRGIVLDDSVYDPFLACESIRSFYRVQQRRQGRTEGDLSSVRRRADIIAAARQLRHLRDCGCNLADEHMSAIEQMLEYPPSPAAWLNAALIAAARYVFTFELLTTDMEDEPLYIPSEFDIIRDLLRNYMQFLNDEANARHTGRPFDNLTDYIMESIGGFIGALVINPQLVHMRPNVDVIRSIRSFVSYMLPTVFSILTSTRITRFLAHPFYIQLGQMYVEMLAFIQCCVVDEFGLRIIYTMLIAHLTEAGENSATRSLRYFSQAIYNQALGMLEDRTLRVRCHVIMVSNPETEENRDMLATTAPTLCRHLRISNNTPVMVDAATTTDSTYNIPRTRDVGTNTDFPVSSAPVTNEGAASVSTATNVEAAQSPPASASTAQMWTPSSLIAQHWDPEHVPVIFSDQATQRAEQAPLSDIYLTGMPSRKRRRIKQSRPPTNLDGFIKESLGEELELLFRQPDDRVALRELFRELMNVRADTDGDYDSSNHSNVTAYMESSNDAEREAEAHED